jgi:hypothetical protein
MVADALGLPEEEAYCQLRLDGLLRPARLLPQDNTGRIFGRTTALNDATCCAH